MSSRNGRRCAYGTAQSLLVRTGSQERRSGRLAENDAEWTHARKIHPERHCGCEKEPRSAQGTKAQCLDHLSGGGLMGPGLSHVTSPSRFPRLLIAENNSSAVEPLIRTLDRGLDVDFDVCTSPRGAV